MHLLQIKGKQECFASLLVKYDLNCSNSKKICSINLLRKKAIKLPKTTILVYPPLIKVSQNNHFWVAPSAVFLERFDGTPNSL